MGWCHGDRLPLSIRPELAAALPVGVVVIPPLPCMASRSCGCMAEPSPPLGMASGLRIGARETPWPRAAVSGLAARGCIRVRDARPPTGRARVFQAPTDDESGLL